MNGVTVLHKCEAQGLVGASEIPESPWLWTRSSLWLVRQTEGTANDQAPAHAQALPICSSLWRRALVVPSDRPRLPRSL